MNFLYELKLSVGSCAKLTVRKDTFYIKSTIKVMFLILQTNSHEIVVNIYCLSKK